MLVSLFFIKERKIDMNFYKVNSNYINYIHNIEQHCIDSIHSIGIILRIEGYIYFLPIESVDASDFNDCGEIRKSTPTILRMIEINKKELLGKCLFSNMFPVPYNEIITVDLTQYSNAIVIEKKLEYIRKNMQRITKAAQRLYKQKCNNYQQDYLLSTVNFKLLEDACRKWEMNKYGKHVNRFPDSQYFLINPYTKGITDYFLMNKNRKIALISMDNVNQHVLNIKEILFEQYAPLECFKQGILTSEAITSWFKGRGIPSWRDGLDDFLDSLGIDNKDMLLNRAFGLSLSDQYWLNPVNMLMDWKDINFFDNNFNSKDYVAANFENRLLDFDHIDFFSPNNTSDGMLRKAWIVGEDNERYMLKGSYRHQGLEPFNEVLASMVAEVLGLSHVNYTLDIISNTVVSKCKCFVDNNTELLSAYAITKYYDIDLHDSYEKVCQSYIEILKEHGLINIEAELWKMFVLDYLIVNEDRHLGNFGVLRDVESLEWISIAPNFDSGQAMFSKKEIYEMNFNHGVGSFFNKKDLDFELILNKIMAFDHLDSIDFSELYEVAERWRMLLNEYQIITQIETDKIDYLYNGFKLRIDKLLMHIKAFTA